MVTKFKNHLAKTNLAKNTVTSYVWTVQYFLNHYGDVNKKNLLAYKGYLVENFKPQTVNLRLQGINKYLEFTKQEKLKVKFVKVQQKNFLENVISDADYKFLKTHLKADGEGGNLAASKIRNLECPSYEICLIDYGCGKFNRKIHIMEQYP